MNNLPFLLTIQYCRLGARTEEFGTVLKGMERRPVILLLENEENDVFFFRRALSACKFEVDVRIVETVGQARDYLEAKGRYSDRRYYPLPDLIVSDFKLNGATGVEFIRWVRGHKDYQEIAVVMFSGTALPQDRAAALQNGALAFFHKSGDFQETCDRVREILNHLRKPEK